MMGSQLDRVVSRRRFRTQTCPDVQCPPADSSSAGGLSRGPDYLWACTCRVTSSRLNDAGFWRGGYFVNSSICEATSPCTR